MALTPADVDRVKAAVYDLRRVLERTEQMRKDPGYTDGQALQVLFRGTAVAYSTLHALPWGDTDL